MEIKSPEIVKKWGRGYGLILGPALLFATIITIVAMWKDSGQMLFYMDWWKELVIWVFGVVMVKEGRKIAGVIKNSGNSQPKKEKEA